MADNDFAEDVNVLSKNVIQRHRAIASMKEALDDIDRFDQRADATNDSTLTAILIENRDEEKVHFARLLAWLRTSDSGLDRAIAEHDPPAGVARTVDDQTVPKMPAPVPDGASKKEDFFRL